MKTKAPAWLDAALAPIEADARAESDAIARDMLRALKAGDLADAKRAALRLCERSEDTYPVGESHLAKALKLLGRK